MRDTIRAALRTSRVMTVAEHHVAMDAEGSEEISQGFFMIPLESACVPFSFPRYAVGINGGGGLCLEPYWVHLGSGCSHSKS